MLKLSELTTVYPLDDTLIYIAKEYILDGTETDNLVGHADKI